MWHSRPPRDPPPFMANAILNFYFDYLTPSLSKERWDHILKNYRRLGRFSFRLWVKYLLLNFVFMLKAKRCEEVA